MADGTLRISFDFEPSDAQAAFALFGTPGTPAAVAALKIGYATVVEEKSEPDQEPKGGALAKLAGMWCADKTFQAWLELDPDNAAPTENGAALCLYALCDIQSRRQLDHDPAAAARFNERIRGPYMKWRASKGLA
jgi:hypothetical protein